MMGANIGTTITGQILRLGDVSSQSLVMTLIKPGLMIPFLTSAVGVVSVLAMCALVAVGWLIIRRIIRIDV